MRGPKIKTIRAFAAAMAFVVSASAAFASGVDSAAKEAEAAVGARMGEYTLIDQDGAAFNLKELKGRPFALAFFYTGCGETCPLILTSLKAALAKASPDFGEKFTALAVGIDVGNDTPARLKSAGSKVTGDFKKWRFATGDKATIERLAKETGFYYKKTGAGFDHINLVTIVGPDGRVFKQVYGTQFTPEEILTPLYDSIKYAGRPAPPWVKKGAELTLLDRIKLLCYTYDEKTGTYRLDYGFLTAIAVFLFVQVTILFVIAYIYTARKKDRRLYRPTIVFKDGPASKKP